MTSRKRTLLDRSVVLVLPEKSEESSPSRKDGISAETERLHRMHGASVIQDACLVLDLIENGVMVSATIIYHRFFAQVSLKESDVWSVAMASTLLAAKTHEISVSVRRLILAFVHVFRKRTLTLPVNDIKRKNPSVVASSKCVAMDDLHKIPAMSMFGPLWKEWHDAVVQVESKVLRQLGFCLHWIPGSHPYAFVPYFLEVLDVDNDRMRAKVQHYCLLSTRVEFCTRFLPESVACAAVYTASLNLQLHLPEAWWRVLCGTDKEQDVATIANCLLGLDDDSNLEVAVADGAFIKSLLSHASFNDPYSFSWDMLVEPIPG